MNTELFISKRIIKGGLTSRLSAPVVRISTFAITIGIVAMIATVAIVSGFKKEIRKKITGFGSDIIITNYDANESFEPIPVSRHQPFLSQLKDHPDIKHIQVYATKNGLIKTKTDNEGVLIKGVDKDHDWSFMLSHLIEGVVPAYSDTAVSKQTLISKKIANKLSLKTGDKFFIFFLTQKKSDNEQEPSAYEQRIKEFYISGIYETGLEEFDSKTVFADLRQIQKLNYWDSTQIAGFEVSLHDFSKVKQMGDEVSEIAGQYLSVKTAYQIAPAIFSWLDLQDANAIIIIVLIVMVAGINLISALLILILERTQTIGVLKAIGANNASIQKIFLYNAFYLILRGLFWGNLIGIGLCLVQSNFGVFTLPQETYYVKEIPIGLRVTDVLLLNVGTIIVSLLMLLLPSFVISRISPVKAIRFD